MEHHVYISVIPIGDRGVFCDPQERTHLDTAEGHELDSSRVPLRFAALCICVRIKEIIEKLQIESLDQGIVGFDHQSKLPQAPAGCVSVEANGIDAHRR